MKINKILSLILAFAMILGTMTISVSAEEIPADAVAMLAGTETYFTDLNDAFKEANNPEGKQVVLLKDYTGDVVVNVNRGVTFYLSNHTFTGQIKVELGAMTIYGQTTINQGRGRIVNTGIDGKYPLYFTGENSNNIYISNCDIVTTATNGVAICSDAKSVRINLTEKDAENNNVKGDIVVNNGSIEVNAGNSVDGDFEVVDGNVSVFGGTFTADVSQYLPLGKKLELDENGKYSVVIDPDAATLDNLKKDGEVYLISNANEFVLFRNLINADKAGSNAFKITNDIDLSGYTLTGGASGRTGRFYGTLDGQNFVIKNVTIDASGKECVGIINSLGDTGVIKNITLQNVEVDGGSFVGALVGRSRAKAIIENCHIKGTVDIEATGTEVGALMGNSVSSIKDCSVDAKGTVSGRACVGGIVGTLSSKGDVSGNSVKGISIIGNAGVGGIIGNVVPAGAVLEENNVTDIKVEGNLQTGLILGLITNSENVILTDNTAVECEAVVAGNAGNSLYGEMNNNNGEVAKVIAVANGKPVTTIAEAIAEVKANGGKVVLYDDVEATSIEILTHSTFDKAIIFDLNGYTYKVVETPNYLYADVTFENGTVEIEEGMSNSQAFFQLYKDGIALKFENVLFRANNYTSNGGVINVNASNATVEFVDSIVELNNEKSGLFIAGNGQRGTNNVNIIGTEMNLVDVKTAITNAVVTITDNAKTGKRSFVKITGTEDGGLKKGINNAAAITITNSDVIITGATETGIALNGDFGAFAINGTSRVVVEGTLSGKDITRSKYTPADVESDIVVADTSRLEADFIEIPAENITGPVVSKADEINLEFRKIADSNNTKWDIYVTGENAQTINKMKSAHFEFDNKSIGIDYTVEASAGISIVGDIDNEDKMAFYINTLDSVEYPTVDDVTNAKTAAEIKLGTITFEGYGTIDFGVTDDAKVNAATIFDNIVETFTPTGTKYVLDITNDLASIKNEKIVEQKRELNVVINFNNDIATQNADYTEMAIEVTGQNGEKHLGLVGEGTTSDATLEVCDYAVIANNAAELNFTVTAGYRYTVKLTGAGYRTAEYTTVIPALTSEELKNDNGITLTFWNNVKDEFNKTEIEEGSDRWYTKNFLAGEIVQDNVINKYDLAAVVSYFGEDELVAKRPEYNKYDLNRDGVIDSEDIAYVLVSFGE